MKTKKKNLPKVARLFVTTFGEHTVFHVLDSGDCHEPAANDPGAILTVRDSQEREVNFLGEELTDLAVQWLILIIYRGHIVISKGTWNEVSRIMRQKGFRPKRGRTPAGLEADIREMLTRAYIRGHATGMEQQRRAQVCGG